MEKVWIIPRPRKRGSSFQVVYHDRRGSRRHYDRSFRSERLAIGADLCNSARAMMFALGCIQALKCNTNHCPVGVTTQDPDLVRGLDVVGKKRRVFNDHRNTVNSFLEILGAAGLSHPHELRPRHIQRRVSPTEVQDYGRIYQCFEPGALLSSSSPGTSPACGDFSEAWEATSAERF